MEQNYSYPYIRKYCITTYFYLLFPFGDRRGWVTIPYKNDRGLAGEDNGSLQSSVFRALDGSGSGSSLSVHS
jgi:hypothetical protein